MHLDPLHAYLQHGYQTLVQPLESVEQNHSLVSTHREENLTLSIEDVMHLASCIHDSIFEVAVERAGRVLWAVLS